MESYTLTDIQESSSFLFHKLKRVRLTYLKFLIQKKMRYVFLCLPPEGEKLVIKEDIHIHFGHFYGLREVKVQYREAGQKSLASPSQEWRADKAVVTFTGKEDTLFLIVPFVFLVELFQSAGLGYIGELNLTQLRRHFSKVLNVIELSVLYSRNLLYYNVLVIFLRMIPEEYGTFLNTLLHSGLIEAPHIASLHLFYPKLNVLIENLSTKNTQIVEKYKSVIAPQLAAAAEKTKWNRQLQYYLQHVVSYLYYDERKITLSQFNLNDNCGLTAKMKGLRVAHRQKRMPVLKIVEYLVKLRMTAVLIRKETKSLLTDLAALEPSFDLSLLYSQFGNTFREDMDLEIRKKKKQRKRQSAKKRYHDYVDTVYTVSVYLESEVEKKFHDRGDAVDIRWIIEKVAHMQQSEIIQLFYRLGFELFADLFAVCAYLPISPVSHRQAEQLFQEKSSLLPETERSIVFDIFHENMNRDRINTPEALSRKYRQLSKRLSYMDSFGCMGSDE